MRSGSLTLPALIFLAAATLEVTGDATIRAGLQTRSFGRVALGAILLAAYGLVVNLAPGDFSRLLGSYVAVFALLAVFVGWYRFGETLTPATCCGLALIVAGGLIVQWGAG